MTIVSVTGVAGTLELRAIAVANWSSYYTGPNGNWILVTTPPTPGWSIITSQNTPNWNTIAV